VSSDVRNSREVRISWGMSRGERGERCEERAADWKREPEGKDVDFVRLVEGCAGVGVGDGEEV
jgi:hypothetical protein